MENFRDFSEKKIFLKDIFDENGNTKKWENILKQHKINKQLYFKCLQPIRAIPNRWKKEMVHDNGSCKNLLLLNHHLIKNNQLHHVGNINTFWRNEK